MQINGEQGRKDMLISFGRRETERSASLTCTRWSLKSLEIFDKELQRRWYMPELGRWNAVDPMALARNWVSPYNYVQNNPMSRIDPTGMIDGDYINSSGKVIGNDGKKDDNVHLVANKSDQKVIRSNDKAGKSTATTDVNIDVTTTKTVLKESLSVLKRTTDGGGVDEHGSVVTPEGAVHQGQSLPTVPGGNGSAIFPNVPDTDNTSIHSHPTAVNEIGGGYDAKRPSGTDVEAFKNYSQNVIIGPLGAPQTQGGEPISRQNGAAFFDRNITTDSKPKAVLTTSAI